MSLATPEIVDRIRVRIGEELDKARADLDSTLAFESGVQKAYRAAEKAEAKAWAEHERNPASEEKLEAWGQASAVLHQASERQLGLHDRISYLRKQVAALSDPDEFERRLAKRLADMEKFAALKMRSEEETMSETPANGDVPPVEDVTGKAPEAKVSKTRIALEAAISALEQADRPLTTAEIMVAIRSNPETEHVNKGTVIVMLSGELRSEQPRIVRLGRGTYATLAVAAREA
jgi:hypothetical protein